MGQAFPFISVIIPTYCRTEGLSGCLAALAGQEYRHDRFEVIVVDDGSEKPPEAIVAHYEKQLTVTLLKEKHGGPAAARNAGAARAGGEFLAFTDDDCAPTPGWLSSLAAHFRSKPCAAVAGRTLNALPENIYSTASQMLTDYLHTYFNPSRSAARFLTSNNLAVPIELFRRVGGFDPSFPVGGGEDREFCDRWLDSGYHLVYNPDVVVYHGHELSFRRFCRQHFNYGRGAHYFHRARARRAQPRPALEPGSFYGRMFSYPLSLHKGFRGYRLASLVMISQVAYATGFVRERLGRPGPRP